jgi:hypothetical protein
MSISKTKELIFEKIPTEVFLAEQAISMDQNVGQYASSLNNSKYRELFGLMQAHAFSSAILSLGNLFERPSQRYPNFSIPTALDYLKADLNNVPVNEASKIKLAEYLSTDPKEQEYLILNPQELKCSLLLDLDDKCPRIPPRRGYPLDASFEALKVLRDKRVAHFEDHDLSRVTTTDWNGIQSLVCYSKSFINLVPYGLFGFSLKGWISTNDLDLLNKPTGKGIRDVIQKLLL